jgi:hypothetical protein
MSITHRLRALFFCMLVIAATTAFAQSPNTNKERNPADGPAVTCQKPVPYFHFTSANETVIPATAPATQPTIVYAARILMGAPNGNVTECSVRQVLFFVPDELANGLDTGNKAPVVQISMDSPDAMGYTEGMLPYGMSRTQSGTETQYTFDAQCMVQSPYTYYINITITGHPKAGASK